MAWEFLHSAKVMRDTETGKLGVRYGKKIEPFMSCPVELNMLDLYDNLVFVPGLQGSTYPVPADVYEALKGASFARVYDDDEEFLKSTQTMPVSSIWLYEFSTDLEIHFSSADSLAAFLEVVTGDFDYLYFNVIIDGVMYYELSNFSDDTSTLLGLSCKDASGETRTIQSVSATSSLTDASNWASAQFNMSTACLARDGSTITIYRPAIEYIALQGANGGIFNVVNEEDYAE